MRRRGRLSDGFRTTGTFGRNRLWKRSMERVHANLSQSKYPHQHYLLFPGYGRGENLRATVGRYGKPDRTPAFLAGGQGIAAARKHPPGADGCSPLEIHGGENYLM